MAFRDHSLDTGMLIAPGLIPFSSEYQHNCDTSLLSMNMGKKWGSPGFYLLESFLA